MMATESPSRPPTSESPDAILLGLVAAHTAAAAAFDAVDPGSHEGFPPESGEAAQRAEEALVASIAGTMAQSLAGLAAKVRALMTYLRLDTVPTANDLLDSGGEGERLLMASILRDVEALA